MAVTQKDIAKKMGLSPSLVSRVLSGRAREVAISEETITKVTQLAEELGYVPNIAAQSLKGIPSRTIGVMVSYFNDPFFGQIIDTLLKYAKQLDYSVVLAGFEHSQEPTSRELRPLLKHQLDGVIVVGSSEHGEWIKSLVDSGIPIAHVGHGPADEYSSRIAIDENKAMKLILEHLKDNNCSRIAYLGLNSLISQTRLKGIQEHAPDLGIKLEGSSILESGVQTGMKDVTGRLLETTPHPDAIICATDKTVHPPPDDRPPTGYEAGKTGLRCRHCQSRASTNHS
jgi:DNA-binding LacI/PurR family transcriptional regulator